jgi:hypothetical protein
MWTQLRGKNSTFNQPENAMSTDTDQRDSTLAEDIAASAVIDETPEVETVETAEAEAAEAEAIAEVLEALEAPPKWDKRYKEVFGQWGEAGEDGGPKYANGRDWQQAVIDLYNEEQAYKTKVEQDRAEIRRQFEQMQGAINPITQAIGPYQQMIMEAGMTPDQAIRQAMGFLASFRSDPKQTLQRLAKAGQIDLKQMTEGEAWQSPEAKEIEDLKRTLAQMQRGQQTAEQQRHQRLLYERQQQTAAELTAFAEATDESGNPKHPDLEKYQGVMAELIYGREGVRRSNPSLPPMSLEEAYAEARRRDPDAVDQERAEQEAARLAKADADAKKVAKAAKRVPAGRTGNEPVNKSLRETIEDSAVMM